MMNKTYQAKPTDVERKWYVIDASKASLGRVSTQIAKLLTGKDKPQFTKHIDCGDFVIVINAKDIVVTGNKMTEKMYYHHSGHPGGLRELSMEQVMVKNPEAIITHAIRGMLPVNKLRDGRLLRLKVYPGTDHKHEAQQPITVEVKEGR